MDYEYEENPDMRKISKPSKPKAYAMIFFGVFICSTMSGVIFGDAALRPVLISSGVYSDRCKPNEDTCDAQLLRLVLLFTVASTMNSVSSLPGGMFLDKFGPRKTGIMGSILFIIGCLFFALSSPSFDGYFAGYIFIAISGQPMYVSVIFIYS